MPYLSEIHYALLRPAYPITSTILQWPLSQTSQPHRLIHREPQDSQNGERTSEAETAPRRRFCIICIDSRKIRQMRTFGLPSTRLFCYTLTMSERSRDLCENVNHTKTMRQIYANSTFLRIQREIRHYMHTVSIEIHNSLSLACTFPTPASYSPYTDRVLLPSFFVLCFKQVPSPRRADTAWQMARWPKNFFQGPVWIACRLRRPLPVSDESARDAFV